MVKDMAFFVATFAAFPLRTLRFKALDRERREENLA
jgi:hypothetical protein